jgi:hypothetical protein
MQWGCHIRRDEKPAGIRRIIAILWPVKQVFMF